jgi:hypothetical protein
MSTFKGSARTERWEREDQAPRLATEFPELRRLRLELSEWIEARKVLDSTRVRHIIVERAAARFEEPCTDPRCKDGGHNLTHQMMQNLRRRLPTFVGQDECSGYLAERPCARILRVIVHAEFDPVER